MQNCILQAAKLQAGASLAQRATAATAARTGAQALRPQAPSFVISSTSGKECGRGLVAVQSVAEAPASVESSHASPSGRDVEVGQRRITDCPFQLKFIVPNAIVIGVLSHDSDDMKGIVQTTGAFIQFNRKGTGVMSRHDRLMTVAGDGLEPCLAAVRIFFNLVKQQGTLNRFIRVGNPSRLYFRQVIPGSSAGKVLGPAGEQIASVCTQSGAKVIVEPKPTNAAFIPFRYVNYLVDSGVLDIDTMLAAVTLVSGLIDQDERYRESIKEIKSVYVRTIEVSERRIGAVLGPGGTHIKALQGMLGCKMGITGGKQPGAKYITVWGPPEKARLAIDVVAAATGGKVRGGEERDEEEAKTPGVYFLDPQLQALEEGEEE